MAEPDTSPADTAGEGGAPTEGPGASAVTAAERGAPTGGPGASADTAAERDAPTGGPGASADTAFGDLLELIGRRWTLRILWELRAGPRPFNDLRRRAGGMSQSVLVTRLTELFGAGLVADTVGGYELTPLGAALVPELERLRDYAADWARTVRS